MALFGVADPWVAEFNSSSIDSLLRNLVKHNSTAYSALKRIVDGREDVHEKARAIFYHGVMKSPDNLYLFCSVLKAIGKKELASRLDDIQTAQSIQAEEQDGKPENQQPANLLYGDITASSAESRYDDQIPSATQEPPNPEKIVKSRLIDRYAIGESAAKTGLCAVIHNFTGAVKKEIKAGKEVLVPDENLRQGYNNDAHRVENFFKSELKYETYGQTDLSYDTFENVLRQLRTMLNKGAYDSFFLFVLSHGDEDVVCMNAPHSSSESDQKRYPVAKIINHFTHDVLPEMKDRPKCFFIQACRGLETPSAAGPDSPTKSHADDVKKDLAVRRDIFLAFATVSRQVAWVYQEGSVFLRHVVEVFREHYKREHLLDMMTRVNWLVSEHGLKIDGKTRYIQMSEIQSTLTKKLYFFSVEVEDNPST